MRGSREISLVPSLHRASTDALINKPIQNDCGMCMALTLDNNFYRAAHRFSRIIILKSFTCIVPCKASVYITDLKDWTVTQDLSIRREPTSKSCWS